VLRDAQQAVADLKSRVDGVLAVMGSGALTQALLHGRQIDEFLLMIHPVVLGSGRRLFAEGAPPAEFRLMSAEPTATGGIIAAYEFPAAH
jgi:dihydrofolate reductase